MAASLRTKALERSVKSNSAAYYSYVEDSKNPVLQSFEAQITDFKNFVAKQQKSNQSIDGRLYVHSRSRLIFYLSSSYLSDPKHCFNYGVLISRESPSGCIVKSSCSSGNFSWHTRSVQCVSERRFSSARSFRNTTLPCFNVISGI